MAGKQRMIELVLSGKMDGSMPATFNKAQRALNKYQRMLTGVSSSEKANAKASRESGGSLLRNILGYAGAYIGVRELTGGIWECVKGYNEEISAENRMFQLMRNVKGTRQSQIIGMKRYAEALMNTTTLTHEATEQGMGQLATFQLNIANIKKLTPAMEDLAVGTFGANVTLQDMQKTGNMLGKVFTGQVGALRKYGISFSKAQEHVLKTGTEAQKTAMLVKVIAQNYGGVAKRMAVTPEGRILQMANAWGEVKESIGAALSPYVMRGMGYIGKNLPQIKTGLMAIVNGGKWLFNVLTPVATVVYNIGSWIVKNWKTVGPIIMGIVGALLIWQGAIKALTLAQAALNVVMNLNPVGLIVAGIGVLIGLIYLLVKNWDKVKSAMARAWNWFVKFGTEGVGRFIPIVNVIALIAWNWDKVTGAIRGAWNWGRRLVSLIAGSKPIQAIVGAGKWIGSKISGKRAAGGSVAGGRSYLVGERGPELFRPRSSGAIVPNHRLAAAGGVTLKFSPSISISGNANRADIDGALQMSERRLEAMIERIMNNRGRRRF